MAIISDEEDPQILAELRSRSREELLHLRDSAKRLNTPRSWGIRFFIIKVLSERYNILYGPDLVALEKEASEIIPHADRAGLLMDEMFIH